MEDFNSLLNYIDDDFTPTGNLCYTNDNGEKLPTTTLQEFYNLRWFIQHFIDKNGYEYGDHDYFNPLNESNWIYQTNKHFMKYLNFSLQEMTPEQLKMNPFKPIIKVNTNHELDTDNGESTKDEEESTTSSEMSEEHSESDTTADDTEESNPTEIHQVHNVYNKSTHAKDELPESEEKPVIEFEIKENGDKEIEKENKLTNTEVNREIN